SLLSFFLNAQDAQTLTDAQVQVMSAYAVLPDRGYTVENIAEDPSLPFVTGDSLRPQQYDTGWLRMIVKSPGPYSRIYKINVFPPVDNTLYMRHAGTRQWQASSGGLNSRPGGSRYWNDLYCV